MMRALALAACATAAIASLSASGPTFWTIGTASEFLRGTSDGVYVSSAGLLSAGPQLTNRLTSAPPQIWSLVEGADGTIWAGTGGDGRVIRSRPGQTEETVFDSEENNVFALAISGSRVYAATSPDGRVYVIEGSAPAKPYFDPTERYIWSLAVDGSGRLWVGTGNPAVLYRIEADGKGQTVYRPPATHVVSLTRDSEGRILAGTEAPGRLYRFDANARPFVLLDSGLTELRASSVGDAGVVFAAAIAKGDEPAGGGEATSVAIALASQTPPSPASASSPPPSSPARRSVIYRIDPSGTWESLWETSDLVYDIAASDDGGVFVATGPEGRLYKVERSREVMLLTGVDARQITRFATATDRARRPSAFATATPGRVVAIGTGVHSPATYTSPVRDSKSVAIWGLIRWEATANVAMYSRSGNTERPDDSWTDWAGPYTRRTGESIKSPAARFLQWRVVLTRPDSASTAPAQVTSVTVSYLPRNTRPNVTGITIHPPGVVFQRPFGGDDAIAGLDDPIADARRPPGDAGPPTPPPGRRMFQKGLQTIVWKADDGDSDRLNFNLHYRREGETNWRPLRSALGDPIYVWDTTTVPDGRYIVRVTATDAPVNSADRALTADRESDPITVDNSPPVIATEIAKQANGVRLVVRVRDAVSPIQKLEFSLAGAPWQLVYPDDGVSDAPEERYEIPLANEADAARVVVRATDWLQNVTSFTVPGR